MLGRMNATEDFVGHNYCTLHFALSRAPCERRGVDRSAAVFNTNSELAAAGQRFCLSVVDTKECWRHHVFCSTAMNIRWGCVEG